MREISVCHHKNKAGFLTFLVLQVSDKAADSQYMGRPENMTYFRRSYKINEENPGEISGISCSLDLRSWEYQVCLLFGRKLLLWMCRAYFFLQEAIWQRKQRRPWQQLPWYSSQQWEIIQKCFWTTQNNCIDLPPFTQENTATLFIMQIKLTGKTSKLICNSKVHVYEVDSGETIRCIIISLTELVFFQIMT